MNVKKFDPIAVLTLTALAGLVGAAVLSGCAPLQTQQDTNDLIMRVETLSDDFKVHANKEPWDDERVKDLEYKSKRSKVKDIELEVRIKELEKYKHAPRRKTNAK